jgi:DNA-binding transcriptional ArsR family regulator
MAEVRVSLNGVENAEKQSAEVRMPDDAVSEKAADLFKMLGDATRFKLFFALSKSEMCVGELSELLSMTQSAVSHQLRLMRTAGLVKPRKDGKNVYYTLRGKELESIMNLGLGEVE